MASLRQNRQGEYIVCFRIDGQQYNRALATQDPKEATARKRRIEATIHDLHTGRLTLPEGCPDVGLFILSDGKMSEKFIMEKPTTLTELWERYLAETPDGAKEVTTRTTERVHFGHLLRHLGKQAAVPLLSTTDLQKYVARREKENGIRGGKVKRQTIMKELATLRMVWNKFALPHKVVKVPFQTHFGALSYPKAQTKPPFQTLDEIEQQAVQPGLNAAKRAELWDCLFLDEKQVVEILGILETSEIAPPWLYRMALAAAHTGARRSELLRSQREDVRIDKGTIHWREKKRDKDQEYTFRCARMSGKLKSVLREWLAKEKGQYTFGTVNLKLAHPSLKAALEGTRYANVRGWHLFRHSLASILAMKGTDQRIIDATLGHSTEDMRERYRHLFPSQQQAVLDSIFG